MTLKTVRLHLHRQGAFFAGQLVTGHLQLQCTCPKTITDLSLRWTGAAKIFAGFSCNNADRRTLSSETYFDTHVSLLDQPPIQPPLNDPTSPFTIPEGDHQLPFTFRLPPNCPTSLQEPYAEVKYAVQLNVRTSAGKPPHRLLVPFSVNGLYDLNKTLLPLDGTTPPAPATVHSAKKGKDKGKKGSGKLGPGLGRTLSLLTRLLPAPGVAPIGCSLQLLREAWVPGEFIRFRVDMHNETKHDVDKVTLALFQESKYVIGGGVVKTGLRQKLCSVDGPVVCARSTETWETNVEDSLYLQVPSVPPTNLGLGPCACKLISLEYFLQLEMQLDSAGATKHDRVRVQVPVVVGNVPHRATFHEFISIKSKENKNKAKEDERDCNNNVGESVSVLEGLGYPDLCEPSFLETSNSFCLSAPPFPTSAHNKGDESDEWGVACHADALQDFEFVPKYANYTSVHGLDLSELMGPPPGLPLPRLSPVGSQVALDTC